MSSCIKKQCSGAYVFKIERRKYHIYLHFEFAGLDSAIEESNSFSGSHVFEVERREYDIPPPVEFASLDPMSELSPIIGESYSLNVPQQNAETKTLDDETTRDISDFMESDVSPVSLSCYGRRETTFGMK